MPPPRTPSQGATFTASASGLVTPSQKLTALLEDITKQQSAKVLYVTNVQTHLDAMLREAFQLKGDIVSQNAVTGLPQTALMFQQQQQLLKLQAQCVGVEGKGEQVRASWMQGGGEVGSGARQGRDSPSPS